MATTEPTLPPASTSWLSYFPIVDGQTTFSIIVGAVLSIALFWLGYKKTVGAKEERVRAVNQDLISSVLRRVAVERQSVALSQFRDMRIAKSYKAALEPERLIGFSETLAIVLSDTIDNNFLDHASKATIIDLIEESKKSITPSEEKVDLDKSSSIDKSSYLITVMAATSALVGAAGSLFSTVAIDKSINDWVKDAASQPAKINAIYLALTAIILSVFLTTFLVMFYARRSRERDKN